MADAEQTISDFKGDNLSVRMFGARGNVRTKTGASTDSGTKVLTCTGAGFSAGDAGKYIQVPEAGPDGGWLITTIASVTDSTHVVLNACDLSVSDKQILWGTDDTAAFQAALDAGLTTTDGIKNATVKELHVPLGTYLITAPLDITNRMRGSLTLRGSGHAYSGNPGTKIIANTGNVLFDCSGSEFIGFEKMCIDGVAGANPSKIGILYARTTDTPQAESQLNWTRNLTIIMGHDAAANGGLGTFGIYDFASELIKHYNLFIQADRPYWATNQNPTNVEDPGVSHALFTITSPIEDVNIPAVVGEYPSFYSVGNTSFDGNCCLISTGGPALTLTGVSNFHAYNLYLNRASGTYDYAINQAGDCYHVNIAGNVEGFPGTYFSRYYAYQLNLNMVQIHIVDGHPAILLDNDGGAALAGIVGGHLRVFPGSPINPIAHPLIDTPGAGALTADIELHPSQSLNCPAGLTAGVRIISPQWQPNITLEYGAAAISELMGRTEFSGMVTVKDEIIGDLNVSRQLNINTNVMVKNITNTNPIVVETATPHGRINGVNSTVTISGVLGTPAANVTDATINVLSPTTFEITGVAGDGNYYGGGKVSGLGLMAVALFGGWWLMGLNTDGSFILYRIGDSGNRFYLSDTLNLISKPTYIQDDCWLATDSGKKAQMNAAQIYNALSLDWLAGGGSRVISVDDYGHVGVASAIRGGPLTLYLGYGTANPVSNQLTIGAGGTTAEIASICFGNGMGGKLTFATNLSGTFTPLFTLKDDGTWSSIKTDLDADRIVKTNSSKVLTVGKVDMAETNDVKWTGASNGDVPAWDSTAGAFAAIPVLISNGSLAVDDMVKVVSTGPVVVGKAGQDDVCTILTGHGTPITGDDVHATLGGTSATLQEIINSLKNDIANLQYSLDATNASVANKVTKNIYSVDMILGTVNLMYG
jgi:hypothetical protein